jgi:hypothetical protein
MAFTTIRRALLRSWLGTLSIHVLLLPPWLLYLARKPWQQWSVADVPLVMFLVLSAGIVAFWTLRLWGAGSRVGRRLLLGPGVWLFRAGQLCTLLLLAYMIAKLTVDGMPGSRAWGEPWTSGEWALYAVAASQGIQHCLFKFTSASPAGRNGWFELLEQGQAKDWRSPLGGSIGVELRRLASASRRAAVSVRGRRPRA